jgi:hypothetical protein
MIKMLPLVGIHGFFGALLIGLFGLRYYTKTHAAETTQPIPTFSHKTHVGKQNIACSQCHELVDPRTVMSPRPGIPTIQKCMECHIDTKDREGWKQLHAYFDKKESIEWNRIHTLPDHVYFTHKRHIKALEKQMGLRLINEDGTGNVQAQAQLCSTCHGEVRQMDKIRQVRSLTMGWCVSCHRTKGVSIDCWTCHK